jgi:hypothetical protein
MSDSDSRPDWNELRKAVHAGGPPPAPQPVDPADLRRYWEFMQRFQAQRPASARGAVGIDIRCLEAELPGVNLLPVWLRADALQVLQVHGALKEWEHGNDLDDVVFQVAATFPFGGNRIDVESFREQLRALFR